MVHIYTSTTMFCRQQIYNSHSLINLWSLWSGKLEHHVRLNRDKDSTISRVCVSETNNLYLYLFFWGKTITRSFKYVVMT